MGSQKNTTSDLFNRYIFLANTIYSAGKITYNQIVEKWRVSCWNYSGSDLPLRTFHEHRKAVEALFDINIECDKRDGFKYYIENSDDLGKDNLRKWLLSSMAVSNLISESKCMRDRILLENIPSGRNLLSQIIEAMKDFQVLEVTHRSFWRDAVYDLRLQPYALKLSHQRWYVLGKNESLGCLRIYALDRLIDCKTTSSHFRIPDDFDAETFFSDYFGVYVNDAIPLVTVRLKVGAVMCNYFRSLPLHHSQTEVETTQEYGVFEFLIRPTDDFVNELVSMSPNVKILSPEWLKGIFKDKILSMYNSLDK